MSTALITGASSGIGYELAWLLAREKHDLVLVARSADRLEKLATELHKTHGVTVKVLAKDLSSNSGAGEVLEALKNKPIDILVNNAGSGEFDRFQEADWDDYRKTLQVNMIALTQLTHGVLPAMLGRGGGQIVNIASTGAFQPLPWMAVYGATKAYVLSLTEALDFELRHTGVNVLAFCPGATASGFAANANAEHSNNFKSSRVVTAASVAQNILKQIQKGRRGVVIDGLLNTIMAYLVPLSPRKVVMAIAERTMAPSKEQTR